MIVDGYGTWPWVKTRLDRFESNNFSTRVYHPLPWPLSKWTWLHLLLRLDKLFLFWLNANRRNHQKLFIFDEKVAIVGSRNINDDAIRWRETSILFNYPSIVQDLISVFNEVWDLSHDKALKRFFNKGKLFKIKSSHQVISTHSFLLRRKRNYLLYEQISEAKNYIYLTTPYFFPTLKILNQIRKKAEKGLDVKILLPQVNDVRISKTIAELQYKMFLQSGVEIYEYKPTILHAKTLIVDDWALLGSSNFNQRSAIRDIELDYSPIQNSTIAALKTKFLEDLKDAKKIEYASELGFFKKMIAILSTKLFPSCF